MHIGCTPDEDVPRRYHVHAARNRASVRDLARYQPSLQHIFRCFQMFSDVFRCFQMFVGLQTATFELTDIVGSDLCRY
jgi:hypothetical protein